MDNNPVMDSVIFVQPDSTRVIWWRPVWGDRTLVRCRPRLQNHLTMRHFHSVAGKLHGRPSQLLIALQQSSIARYSSRIAIFAYPTLTRLNRASSFYLSQTAEAELNARNKWTYWYEYGVDVCVCVSTDWSQERNTTIHWKHKAKNYQNSANEPSVMRDLLHGTVYLIIQSTTNTASFKRQLKTFMFSACSYYWTV